MKPRDIRSENFDVNVAVLDLDQHTEIRITYGGDAIWFRPHSSVFNTSIMLPIKVWNEIVDFVLDFKKEDLERENIEGYHHIQFCPKGNKYEVLIHNEMVVSDQGAKVKKIRKLPLTVMIGSLSKQGWRLTLYMSQLKKIIKWYNADAY